MRDIISSLVDNNIDLQEKLVECNVRPRPKPEVVEGIVSNTDEDSEETAIKKLSEEAAEDKDMTSSEQDMEQDVTEEPAEEESDEIEDQVEKQYFGKSGDNHYYLVGTETDSGETSDLQIVDQEGELVYSAKDNEVEITDTVNFIISAIQEMDIEDISYDVFEKYILPKLVEPDPEEEFTEEDDNMGDTEEDASMIPEDEETFESIAKTSYVHEDKEYDIRLLPENKVKIGGKVFTLSEDTLGFYNIKEGKVDEADLNTLAKDMIRAMDENELKSLVEGYEEKGKRDGTGPHKDSAQRSVSDKGKRKQAGEKCPAEKEDDKMKKTNEDITSNVKELQKKAEAAVKDGNYVDAADYVSRLANVESSVGSVEDEVSLETTPGVDEPDLEAEVEVEETDDVDETEEDKVEETVKDKELPEDIKEQVNMLNNLLGNN